MLEGPLFVRELAELSKDFICTSFEGVFSSKSSAKHKPSSPTVTSEVTQPNYAAVAKNASPSTLQSPITGISQARKLNCKILRNKNGERVDEYVIHSPAIEYKLLPKRLCHRHHLLGHCNFNRCQHQSTHQLAINDEEWRALRNIARRSLCLKGLSCSERNCVLGHQCVKNCPKIGAGCRFPESLHGVDTQVVSVE